MTALLGWTKGKYYWTSDGLQYFCEIRFTFKTIQTQFNEVSALDCA
ncbi:MAG TPA: hypothetical protein VHS05_20055 [Pyrinomonadaceae bacterium]|nr:hypothetical protein [Pyrinomonadaceae bacterium]